MNTSHNSDGTLNNIESAPQNTDINGQPQLHAEFGNHSTAATENGAATTAPDAPQPLGGTTPGNGLQITLENTNTTEPKNAISDYWQHPAVVTASNFKLKSLCEWVVNTAIGCSHGCRFCYVPSTSTNKQKPTLAPLGVNDPDAQWGSYVFPRTWDEEEFNASLRRAENTAQGKLKADGHRAIMFCSTTDPYQVIKNPDPEKARELTRHHQAIVRNALELIRDESTLKVRILTRSGLARTDFELMRGYGNRLTFGMSLPTLNDTLARIYEPNAPSPTQRMKTLRAAKDAGLNVYVAVAPTYPECDEADLRATLEAVAALDPITVFHEPINMRAENVARIATHAASLGVALNAAVFADDTAWSAYAIPQLRLVQRIAGEVGLADRLHLWPDASLKAKKRFMAMRTAERLAGTGIGDDEVAYAEHLVWLEKCHTRVSEWPA